jgi:dihydrofolate reductase
MRTNFLLFRENSRHTCPDAGAGEETVLYGFVPPKTGEPKNKRRHSMGKITVFMSMSLDGFIAGPKDDNKPDRELEALDRLSDWMFRGKTDSEAVEFQERLFKPIGAIVMGRRIFDLGVGPWGDNPVYHAPVFVLSHRPKEKVVKQGGTTYTFVTDGAERALTQAKAAAGNKDIRVIGGASAIQQFIKAGWLDEIEIHLIPILLGEGIRLFENIGTEPINFEQISLTEEPGVTHFRFRVVK